MEQKKVRNKLSGRKGELIYIKCIDGSQISVLFVGFNDDFSSIKTMPEPHLWPSLENPPEPLEVNLEHIEDIEDEDDMEAERERKEQASEDYWWDSHYYRAV